MGTVEPAHLLLQILAVVVLEFARPKKKALNNT